MKIIVSLRKVLDICGMHLDELQKGQRARILELQGDEQLTERLGELGFLIGNEVEFLGQAPFRGPRLYKVFNTMVALRQDEVQCVLVGSL